VRIHFAISQIRSRKRFPGVELDGTIGRPSRSADAAGSPGRLRAAPLCHDGRSELVLSQPESRVGRNGASSPDEPRLAVIASAIARALVS
jgi:hypothetical protein